MGSPEDRRAAPRYRVDVPGELSLSDGRRIAVRIVNLGRLGALLHVRDNEVPINELERAMLVHPELEEGQATGVTRSTAGSIVRVDRDFDGEGVSRLLAIYFDGGGPPA